MDMTTQELISVSHGVRLNVYCNREKMRLPESARYYVREKLGNVITIQRAVSADEGGSSPFFINRKKASKLGKSLGRLEMSTTGQKFKPFGKVNVMADVKRNSNMEVVALRFTLPKDLSPPMRKSHKTPVFKKARRDSTAEISTPIPSGSGSIIDKPVAVYQAIPPQDAAAFKRTKTPSHPMAEHLSSSEGGPRMEQRFPNGDLCVMEDGSVTVHGGASSDSIKGMITMLENCQRLLPSN